MPPIEPPITDVPRVDPEVVRQPGLGAHHVADGDHREAASRTAGRRRGAATPARSMPWQPPSTFAHTTNQRSVSIGLPGPIRSSHQPRRRVAAAGRAGGVAVAGPGVAHAGSRCDAVGVEPSPGLVGDGDVVQRHAACRARSGRSCGEREELAVARRVAGAPCARDREWLPSSTRPFALVAWCRCLTCHRQVAARAEALLPRPLPGPHPHRGGKAPWGFLPGCRIACRRRTCGPDHS